MKVLEAPLDAVSRDAKAYPAHLLVERGEGLCLFAARFFGINDAVHMARLEMEIMLVDTSPRVHEMGAMYGCWAMMRDAWEYAEECRDDARIWDNVSVDNYTGDAGTRSLASLELWCSLARKSVTVTYVKGQEYTLPEGWRGWLFPRNPRKGVYWLVLERA